MSSWPTGRIWACPAKSDGGEAIPGDDLRAENGAVTLNVKVQCPNWFDVNRVQVFLNGRAASSMNYNRRNAAGKFGTGAVKFDQHLALKLDSDTHIIVATIGENLTLGPVMGPRHGDDVPAALSNPIFVDVDGGGFQPNQDLLGMPLPYKKD